MAISHSVIPTLIKGYKQFRAEHFTESSAFHELVQNGQKPKALVVACCDSRVDPAIVLGCQPGDLFVIRNVANLVPPFKSDPRHHGTSAALEFGVCGLEVSDVIVFGHRYCGGIQALMEAQDDKPSDFVGAWMDIARPAKQRVLSEYSGSTPEQKAYHCEQESLLISLQNLQTFPWIQKRIGEGRLFLHAWYFDLGSGVIEAYQPATRKFISLG